MRGSNSKWPQTNISGIFMKYLILFLAISWMTTLLQAQTFPSGPASTIGQSGPSTSTRPSTAPSPLAAPQAGIKVALLPTSVMNGPTSPWLGWIVPFVFGLILGFFGQYLYPTIREMKSLRREALQSIYLNLSALRTLYMHQAGDFKIGTSNPGRAKQIEALEGSIRQALLKITKLDQNSSILEAMSGGKWRNDPYGRHGEIGRILDGLGKAVNPEYHAVITDLQKADQSRIRAAI